ncbi:hypothetical protein HanXRQr2_Chr09g0374841 [Helianthus annuus]|uniref:Uncharacterized protein n=1 Tax=Helianthus annuus TaxID=4232 RepID=A0A9K3N7K3_HELAN|nr:hypothetical protein HanXRQr2_Chr09g0374841 [Helianthus annuus]KAJ0892058.1 hypothetical protein HanPSC8_Chr09g0361381 [Helianthus annuus]
MKKPSNPKLVLSTSQCSKSLDFQIIVAPPDCKEIICNQDFQLINSVEQIIQQRDNQLFNSSK